MPWTPEACMQNTTCVNFQSEKSVTALYLVLGKLLERPATKHPACHRFRTIWSSLVRRGCNCEERRVAHCTLAWIDVINKSPIMFGRGPDLYSLLPVLRPSRTCVHAATLQRSPLSDYHPHYPVHHCRLEFKQRVNRSTLCTMKK
jgi:hypothetical protein